MNTNIDPKHLEETGLLVADYYKKNGVIAPGSTSTITLTLTNQDGKITASCTDMNSINTNVHFLKENAEEVWEREHGTEKFYGQRICRVLALLDRDPSKCTMYHLASTSQFQILKIRECGDKVLRRIKNWLEEEHRLCLGMRFPKEITSQFADKELAQDQYFKIGQYMGDKIANGEV